MVQSFCRRKGRWRRRLRLLLPPPSLSSLIDCKNGEAHTHTHTHAHTARSCGESEREGETHSESAKRNVERYGTKKRRGGGKNYALAKVDKVVAASNTGTLFCRCCLRVFLGKLSYLEKCWVFLIPALTCRCSSGTKFLFPFPCLFSPWREMRGTLQAEERREGGRGRGRGKPCLEGVSP